LFGEDIVKFVGIDGRESLTETIARAIAAAEDFILIEDVVLNIFKSEVSDVLAGEPAVEERGDAADEGDVAFDSGDGVFIGEGEELDEDAAGGEAGAIGGDEDAERADGRDLFAFSVIGSDILSDLTGDDVNDTDVGIFFADVLNDVKGTATDSATDVKFPVGSAGEIGMRILDISFNVAEVIADGEDVAGGAVAAEINGNGVALVFQGRADKRGGDEHAAEGGGSGRRGMMPGDSLVHEVAGVKDEDLSGAVAGHSAEQFSHIFKIPFCWLRWF